MATLKDNLAKISPNLSEFYGSIDVLSEGCRKEAIQVLLKEVEEIEDQTDNSLLETFESRNHIAYGVLADRLGVIREVKAELEDILSK